MNLAFISSDLIYCRCFDLEKCLICDFLNFGLDTADITAKKSTRVCEEEARPGKNKTISHPPITMHLLQRSASTLNSLNTKVTPSCRDNQPCKGSKKKAIV